MLERRRRAPAEEAEDEAEEEVEVLKGGRQKALEDEKSEKEVEEDQVVGTGGEGTKSRGGEFLRTPSRPALEEGVGKTSDEGETSAKKIEEYKTPRTMKETPREETSSTREREKEGKTASAAETPLYRPAGAPQALETSPRWPGGPTTSPTILRPDIQPEQTEQKPLFDDEQLRRYNELRRQAPMLNPQGVDEKTLQEMRPDALREEELKRLRKREEELEMERTILLHERASLQRQLRDREALKKCLDERQEERRQRAAEEDDVQYRTPEEESNTAKRLFHEESAEAVRPPRPEEATRHRLDEADRHPVEVDRPPKKEPGADEPPGTLQLMAMMMQSMQEMQKRMNSKDGGKDRDGGEAEYVRSHPEVPKLPDWNPSTGPIDLNDWLALIEPIMADLTATSGEWWDRLQKECRQWYQDHMALNPLDRLAHEPTPSVQLDQPRWIRLERRASTLLMMSIPEAQKEELVSTKRITAMKILCHLFTTFQPGGLAEKEVILRSLEMPVEATTMAEAVSSLRKWMRWRRRAMELQVSEPDPFLLLKGLGRIVRKPLEANRELNFRVSLARSMLQVDSTPTRDTVGKFATHLLAEIEQIAHLDSSKKSTSKDTPRTAQPEVKMKKIEEGKGEGKSGKGVRAPCRFFLTEEGCRKGKECAWQHVLDDKKRCWNCGGIDHFAPACTRPKEAAGDKNAKGGDGKGWSRPMTKAARKEDSPKKEEQPAKEETQEAASSTETMKGLLEEANKMLKSMTQKNQEDEEKTKDIKLQAMQAQLDELKKMKVLKLSRIAKEETKYGLLDSGATHAMRGKKKGEKTETYEKVKVTLANGQQVEMKMAPSGIMVMEEEEGVEPIIPMSTLAGQLGYTIHWAQGKMKLTHPHRSDIKVTMCNGCPQVPKKVALKIIQEIEDGGGLKKAVVNQEEEKWLREMTQCHPVLKHLPARIKEQLVVTPAESLKGLPECNRRRRKIMEEEGFVLHLYAGSRDGYTLSRALQECGGDKRRLLEVDVLRQEEGQPKHDMLAEDGPYAALMRAALDGTMKGVIMGPNCRTRSVLRHYPLPVPGGGPRPVRSWEEPWGMARNTKEEQDKVNDDDVLMWRGLMLFIAHEEMRQALKRGEDEAMFLGLEQPADPTHYMPATVTFWKTPEWTQLKQRYKLKEQTFLQSRWGGKAKKPTTFGGNLSLRLPDSQEDEDEVKVQEEEPLRSSKDLSRWAPGMMKQVATQIIQQIFKKKVRASKMSWEEHVQRGHTPFRRDCQICQEASARGRMHHKISHPRAGVMSLDVAGPFHKGHDVEGQAKFMLIGTYTWIKPQEEPGEEAPNPEAEEADQVEDQQEEEEVGPQLEDPDEEQQEDEEEEADMPDEDEDDARPEGQAEEAVEERREPVIEVIRIGVPMRGKSQEVVLEGVAELYLQLRADGFPVHTLHTDRGKEFINKKMKTWLRSRGVLHSTNAGEDPMANGRAERAVGEVKRMVRRLLHASAMGVMWWPMALRYLMETARLERREEKKSIPGFGDKVLIKKRNWRTKLLEPTHEVSHYLTPVVETHGHCVLRENGRWGIAPYVVRNVKYPPPPTQQMWLALAEEADRDEVQERRRIRDRRPIRGEEQAHLRSIRLMLKEEAASIEIDSMENAQMMFKKIEPWRKLLKKAEAQEEEILQTKIISPQEMIRDLSLWDAAIKSEMDSLFVQKEALKKITKEEKEDLLKKHPEVTILPSKLVITRKPGGRRKIRIVVCGNYAERQEGEELSARGSDTISMRIAIKKAIQAGWEGAAADIRTAFLNAPIQAEEADMDESTVLIAPPYLLTKLGYTDPNECWMALKAMYGLRQSPKTWGDYRDATLGEVSWKDGQDEVVFRPLVSDPNVWKIVVKNDELEEKMKGVMLVYVDDLLILGEKGVVQGSLTRIKEEWDISPPEWLGPHKPVRFLGIDIWKSEAGIFLTQESYAKDVLKRSGDEKEHLSGVPITKDQSQRLEEEDPQKNAESVRLAQKATGELMWLGTKTRPDLMFTLARMSQSTLKSPKEVVTVGAQARKYLRKTLEEGLWMKKDEEEDLVVYTDSSYGPGGLDSQGTVVVMWGGTAIMWKAGRQPTPALSTAESELAEAVEGMIMGDSVDVMIQELAQKPYAKMIKIDNQAAVNLLSEPAGGWRTRHLRLRAANLRWRLSRTDWMTEAIPGADQIADVGTKVLTAPRLEELKKMMGMGKMKKEEEASKEDEKKEEEKSKGDEAEAEKKTADEEEQKIAMMKATHLIQLAVIVGCMGQVEAQGQDEEEHEERAELFHVMVLFALAVIGLMSLIERIAPFLMRLFTRRRGVSQPEEETDPEGETEEDDEEADPGVPFEHGNMTLQPTLPRNAVGPKPPPAALANRLQAQAKAYAQAQAQIPQDQPASSSTTPVLQPPQPPSQPAEEPPRLVEEFLGSVVQEPVEHPEDANWDQIGPGKGTPRPASSATNSSATTPARDHKGSPGYQAKGRGKKGTEDGQKGQKAGPAKGKATPEEEEEEIEYEAQELPEVWTPEDQRRGRGPAYVTPWGSKWHFLTTCPTLANARVMRPSRWCSLCARWLHYDGPIYTTGPGQTAHQDPSCPRRTQPSRTYQQCQICCEHYERTA